MRPMKGLGPWFALVRFNEYGPLFLLCPVAGALLAGGTMALGFVLLLVFVTAVSISTFVLNDITDADVDSHRGVVRNPVGKGEIRKPQATAFFLLLAFISATVAPFLGVQDLVLAAVALVICWGYSFGLKFKAFPVSDLAAHGMIPATFVLMGYALYVPVSAGGLALTALVAVFSAMSGTLQELRDVAQDEVNRRTTVKAIGPKRSALLALGLGVVGVLLFAALVILGHLDPLLVLFLPAGVFILAPILDVRSGSVDVARAIVRIRDRGVALALAIMLADLALILW